MQVAKAYPKLQIVVEDRELVIERAKQFWQDILPSHISEHKVHLIPRNFFEEQPKLPGPVDVFLLRYVTHDWSDKYAIKVLRRVGDAAGPSMKLVIIDDVVEHACGPKQMSEKVPAPLLPKLGAANLLAYSHDLVVFGAASASERTEEGFREILSASGWQLEEIHGKSSGSVYGLSIISVPV